MFGLPVGAQAQTGWRACLAHGDDDGLILPPKIAPLQVVIIPMSGRMPTSKDK
jgi:prolyl-tRNA synthetase